MKSKYLSFNKPNIMAFNHEVLEIKECYDIEKYLQTKFTHNPTISVMSRNIGYNMFFTKHLLPNMPCILSGVSDSWECSKTWIKNDQINHQYFRSTYGELEGPVADCHKTKFNSHCKQDMKVLEYMNYLEKPDARLLYLKDWHLRRAKPDDNFYEVPNVFASDWLNEYALEHGEDDFMFVYVGIRGSWTPLHVDVYSSYSWSVNVTGLKKWILFPPGEERKFKDSLGNLPLTLDKANLENVKYFEIYQKKGDAIFVPSGWHHQVMNLEDTISINHNWFNGCNLHYVFEALEENMSLVEEEIDEFKTTPGFYTHCQLMLKALFGMNYPMFFQIILYICDKRLLELENGSKKYFSRYCFGNNHIKFDLKCILKIIEIVMKKFSYYDKYLENDIKDRILEAHTVLHKLFK